MDIVMRKVSDLTPYNKNAKKHDEKQVANVANSIRRFGWQQPIVIDDNGVVVIGHCRLLAAKKLRLKEVPVTVASGLTEDEVKELRIADNKTNESPWDLALLAEDTEGLDFEGFDWDLGIDVETGGGVTTDDIVEDDFDAVPPEKPKAKIGDVYQLGRHRLMCGDSTSILDVEKLCNGNAIDLVVTDPPYNMAYEGAGNTRDRAEKRILNDKMPESEFAAFLRNVYANYHCIMADGASIYVFYKEMGTGVFITAMKEAGLTYKQELVWVKNQIVLGGSKYQSMYEPFLMGCKGKSIQKWNGKRKQRSVIESIDLMGEEALRQTIRDLLDAESTDVLRERKQLVNDLHPTMKPVRLIAKLILNSSDKGDCVMDLFGGSGTTLIAAEQTGRSAYLMELDPKYVDVIIARWEAFTGEKAVLLNG